MSGGDNVAVGSPRRLARLISDFAERPIMASIRSGVAAVVRRVSGPPAAGTVKMPNRPSRLPQNVCVSPSGDQPCQ